ncbi:MAG: tetratricopeptide repeat protein [Chloroflexota bacterium]
MMLDSKQLAQIDQWLATGDARRAETQIARLLRNDFPPLDRAQLLTRRAKARILLERPDEALEDLQTMRALAPELWEQPNVQELLGDAYFSRFELAPVGFAERADAVLARTIYEGIATRDPNYGNLGWVLYQWGRVLLSENNVEQAVVQFTAALVKPSSVPRLTALVYERLGFIHLTEKREAATALAFFSRAVTTYPSGDSPAWLMRLHLLRSRAYRQQNLYDDALKAAQVALATIGALEPDYRVLMTEGHLTLGEILAGIPGREHEAADHLLQFLQHSRRPQGVDVTWSRIHETLGNLWFRLKHYEQAIVAYQTALSFNPYHPLEIQLQYQIARCYYRLRGYEKTIAAIEQLLKLAAAEQQSITDYSVFGVLANAHFALEQYPEAVIAFRQAIELAPPDAENLEQFKTYLKAAEEMTRQH